MVVHPAGCVADRPGRVVEQVGEAAGLEVSAGTGTLVGQKLAAEVVGGVFVGFDELAPRGRGGSCGVHRCADRDRTAWRRRTGAGVGGAGWARRFA